MSTDFFQWAVVLGLGLLIVVLYRVSQAVLAVCDVLLRINDRAENLGYLVFLDDIKEITDILKAWNDKSDKERGI